MMSTSSHSKAENGVIQSSIGLLQERFRQLQRMKEMRENKELLRMFSDYNNNTRNTTNTTTTTSNVSPIIVCNTSSYTNSTITSTTTISGTPNNNNNNNNNNINIMNMNMNMNNNDNKNESDCSMQYNDQLQIFIPPNYSSLNNPKSSCYSSSSSAAATTTSPLSSSTLSSSSSSSSQKSNMINPSDVSLSLWCYSNSSTPATTYPFRGEKSDNMLSTMKMQRAVAGVGVSRASTSNTCVSSFHNKKEDPRHVTDVDTTLHL